LTVLFDPTVRLEFFTETRTIIIEDLHMDFSTTATVDSKPNTAKISVYNISDSTRQLMSEKFVGFNFYAGYGDDTAIIFRGAATNVLSQKVGTDWRTDIYGGDGEKEFSEIFFSQAYPAGTQIKKIIESVAAAMGYSANSSVVLETDTLLKGASYSGRAKDVLDEITKDFDYTWSVQWGALEILDSSEFLGNVATAVVLSADTGMLDSPTLIDRETKNKKIVGVKVKSLLNPAIKPGRLIEIRSQSTNTAIGALNKSPVAKSSANGLWIVKRADYVGNNYGGEFVVNIEADQRPL
jgi:hypothetical protein